MVASGDLKSLCLEQLLKEHELIPCYAHYLLKTLRLAIQKLREWANARNLPLAPEMSLCMRTGPPVAHSEYFVCDYPISNILLVTDFGFHCVDRLDFLEHYKVIQRKAYLRMFQYFKTLCIPFQVHAYKAA